jgi:acetyl esterase/lipase
MSNRHHAFSTVSLLLVLMLAVPALAGRPAAAASDDAGIEPLLETTFNALGTLPLAVTVSRVVITPGATDEEAVAGPRLVVVESGLLTLTTTIPIEVTHNAAAADALPTETAATAPTPTAVGSVTPAQFLDPGDTFPVPVQLMIALRNEGTVPATILDVRISSFDAALPPANLDSETIDTEYGVYVTSGPSAVALGRGTMAAGGSVAAPPAGGYRLVVASHGGGDGLAWQADGSIRNDGTQAVDVYVLSIAPAAAAIPSQPTQPAAGPGGAEVVYDQVIVTHRTDQPADYWLFEPASPHDGGATPTASAPLPLVFFFSPACCDETAVGGIYPEVFQAWIDHTVKRGAVVVVPSFRVTNPIDDAVAGIRAAMADLANGAHPATDPNRVIAFGHSYGSVLEVNYAAVAAKEGLPVPVALLATVPGCGCLRDDLSAVPATTRLVVVVGSDDYFAGDADARRIWAGLPQIPADRKDYVRLMSDDHGGPVLVADHPMPATAEWGPLDALDWYGTWKLLDALIDCAYAGQGCDTYFGNTPAERFMGVWSDGVPVTEAQVVADPGPPPPVATPTA